MPKPFRDLFILALIMTASCLNVTEDDTTTTSTSTSSSVMTSNTFNAMTMMTMTTARTTTIAMSISSTTVIVQDDNISKSLSHTSPLPLSSSSSSVSSSPSVAIWECPNITKSGVECSCDFPHTLRCTGDKTALKVIMAIYNCHYIKTCILNMQN